MGSREPNRGRTRSRRRKETPADPLGVAGGRPDPPPRLVASAQLSPASHRDPGGDGRRGLADGAACTTAQGAVTPSAAPPRTGLAGQDRAIARLIERLLSFGSEALADDELLDLFLATVLPPQQRERAATELLLRHRSVPRLLAAPVPSLLAAPDMTREAAALLHAVRALALRMLGAKLQVRPMMRSRQQVIRFFDVALGPLAHESLCVMYLDRQTRLITYDLIRTTSPDNIPVTPRDIIARALAANATGLMLVHNHPSGDPVPSLPDVELTQQIAAIGRMLGLVLHDHIIVGGGRTMSMKDAGLL